MSLEQQIHELIGMVAKTNDWLSKIAVALEDQHMTEFSESELAEVQDVVRVEKAEEDFAEEGFIERVVNEEVQRQAALTRKRITDLIDLSRKMNMPYNLSDDGKLVVDNAVLSAYAEQEMGNEFTK